MHISASYILRERKQFIKRYKKKWKTDLTIGDVAVDVNKENVDYILKIMMDTGYTFSVAYMIYKYGNENTFNIISMSDIIVPIYMSTPKQQKIQSKMDDLLIRGTIKPVVINSAYEIVDGYATFLALKRLGDKYIIYEVDDFHVTKKRRSNSAIRLKLYDKQDSRCYICGRTTKLEAEYENSDDFATVDHIVPISKGGNNIEDNLALCCKLCNNLKGNFRYSEELKKVILMELEERGIINSE